MLLMSSKSASPVSALAVNDRRVRFLHSNEYLLLAQKKQLALTLNEAESSVSCTLALASLWLTTGLGTLIAGQEGKLTVYASLKFSKIVSFDGFVL